jgi:hypothetical protein
LSLLGILLLEFVLMTFGRHQQQLGEKARPVFDALHIAPKRLVQKDLYASLKLLPSILDACTGMLSASRVAAATIRDIEYIAFMVCSPVLVTV